MIICGGILSFQAADWDPRLDKICETTSSCETHSVISQELKAGTERSSCVGLIGRIPHVYEATINHKRNFSISEIPQLKQILTSSEGMMIAAIKQGSIAPEPSADSQYKYADHSIPTDGCPNPGVPQKKT